MPIDVSRPLSPGWWLAKLMKTLGERQTRYNLLDSYSRSDSPMPWGPENCTPAFRRFQSKARLNFAPMISGAVGERMKPVGFRTGADGDETGDKEAWSIYQANGLDADMPKLIGAMLNMSDAYMIVGGPDPSIGGRPLITPEDPRQVATFADPRNRRKTLAALKVFADDVTNADLAYLYLPGKVYRARRGAQASQELSFDAGGWEWYSADDLPHPVVPVVRFPNRPDLVGNTMGEFEDALDDIDRIQIMVLQRMTVAVMQAFRQRAIKGDLPATDQDGEAIDYNSIFTADPGALWRLPEGVDMWESAGVDLTPLLESVKADIRDLAAQTRTPMHYLFPDAANGSAEGASLMREGLIFKVADRIAQTSDPLEQVMSLAFLFAGDTVRANRSDMEVLWQPPEHFSLAERYDAASKATGAGVPWRTTMTDVLQFSPQQVDRMEGERAAEAFLAAAAAPVDTAPVP